MCTLSRLGTVLRKHVWWTFEKCKNNFTTFKKLGNKLKAERCFLFKTEVKYLGQIINSEDYRENPLNIAVIKNLKETPKNVVYLQKLLSFTGY